MDESDKQKLAGIIEQKNSENTQWGWKEPRTCLFIDDYVSAIKDPIFLIIYRHYYEVIESLISREYKVLLSNISTLKWYVKFQKIIYFKYKLKPVLIEEYLNAWILYNLNLVSDRIKNDPNSFYLNYKDLLNHDSQLIDWLRSKGIKINHVPFTAIFDNKKIHANKNGKKFKIRNKELVKKADSLLSKLNSLNICR